MIFCVNLNSSLNIKNHNIKRSRKKSSRTTSDVKTCIRQLKSSSTKQLKAWPQHLDQLHYKNEKNLISQEKYSNKLEDCITNTYEDFTQLSFHHF